MGPFFRCAIVCFEVLWYTVTEFPSLQGRGRALDYNELLHVSADVGSELLENGAETYRVEESVYRLVSAYGAREANVFAVPTCIIVSITLGDGSTVGKTRRIYARGTNLDRIDRLNDLCRRICQGQIPLESAYGELEAIRRQGGSPPLRRCAGFVMIAFAFALFFGGTLPDAVCAAVMGLVMFFVVFALERWKANAVFINIIASGVTMMLALAAVGLGTGQNIDMMVIGTLMNLVPGVALTNAMRDIMAGDYLAGQARLTEALLTAAAMALGAGAALAVARMI